MDQNPSQTPTGLHRSSVTASSLPPEYWNTLDSLYPAPDLQQQQQPQLPQQSQLPQQPSASQQPLGISWDHPIFHQQQPQPRNQIPRHQEQNHGIYSSTPQSWQPNPLYQPIMPSSKPQGLGVQPQYSQVHQFPQSQLAFDSQSIPSDSTTFDAIQFPQDFFPPQRLSVPDISTQPSSQRATPSQPTPPAPYQSNAQQNPINQYSIPPGFPEEASHTPINFPNGFSDPATNQQTINPLFLNTPHQSGNQQHATINDNFLYLSPADFERSSNSKPFNYYRNDLQAPLSNQHAMGNQSIAAKFPKVEVVINNARAPAGKKPLAPQNKTAAQKQAKTQAKRAGKQAGDGSSSGSDSDSSIEIQLPPEEPSPIPSARPSEPLAAARYDALWAVWSPRNRRPNSEKVKNALVAFKNVVKAVRDTWKDRSQAMKTAENQGENDKAIRLKNEVVLQRRLMDVVVSTTLEMGHPMIVEKLGEHPMAVSAMYSFLLDRHQAADVDGALTVNILKLLSHFVTVDEDVLQKTNVAKLLPRFSKKGGQSVKDLTKRILDNAASSTKRKQGSKEESPSKNTTPDATATNGSRVEAAGSKRPRDGESREGSVQPAAKRMVVTSNTKNPSKPGSTGIANSATAKRPQETGQDAKATTATAARPKANIIAPKPTNLFGSLSSAKKRPGTSNAERAAAAAKSNVPEKKREAAPPPPKPAFSLGDIMADLDKPKDPGPVEPTEDKPPETEEERKKRLRKEGRRRLRVSWKPDHSLTEVRLFTHDPEEELSPGDRRQRQAGDVKGEGRILKLHKDLDELGEEDEGGIKEENLLGYHELSEIDNADITPDDRARNYNKRGGTQEPTSPEKQAQEHREATTLMVFYTSLADIPPSPKEPPPPSEDEIVPDVQILGELPDHVKARQERYFAYVNPKPAPTTQPAAPTNQFDISNLLKIIQSATQQQQLQPPAQPLPTQQPVSQVPASDLERTVNMFRQQQAPAPLPQIPQFPMSQPPVTQGMDFGNIFSIMNAQNQMQPPSVFPPAPQSQPGIAPNLAAIISQLNNQNQAGNPSSQVYEDPERKRMRETSGFDGAGDDKFNPAKRNRPNGPHKKHPKVGIVPCRYWKEGKCLKGDDCTFRHDPLT